MAIKSFNPEPSRFSSPSERSLEGKLVTNKEYVSHKEVQDYANYIISELDKIKKSANDVKVSFVLDALNDDRIFEKFLFEVGYDGIAKLDRNDAKNSLKRIRKALVEELKGKIDSKIYLVFQDIKKEINEDEETVGSSASDLSAGVNKKLVLPKPHKRNVISAAMDVDSGEERIFKDQQWRGPKRPEGDMSLFLKLDPHPNIVRVKEYDPVDRTVIYEKRNFETVLEYARNNGVDFLKNPKDFFFVLKAISDAMSGASYLADNHLVLQDIKLDNIGLEKDGDIAKGVLFDLEGLVKENTVRSSRLSGPSYRPPEVSKSELEGVSVTEIRPSEMTFQFGVCLRKVLIGSVRKDVYEALKRNPSGISKIDLGLVDDLQVLAVQMQESDPEKRIDLKSAQAELVRIVEKIEKSLL